MVSAEREPIWNLGLGPQWVPRAKLLVRGLGVLPPPQKLTIFQLGICHFKVFHDISGINLLHESVLNFLHDYY